MNIAFRVDASSQIGTGHFMRCLTLAEELKQREAQLCFVSRHLPDHLREMLEEKGHEFVLLDGAQQDTTWDELAHARWLGVSQAEDAAATIQALSGQKWNWLVVDHYALDFRWESALRQTVENILVIDDIADRLHDCDVLLDQNYYVDMESRHVGKVPTHCQLLLGPRYALLRDEFRKLREQVKPRSGPVKRVFVFFGGVDAENHTSLAIKALAELEVEELHVDVVIGAQHPYRSEIEVACAVHKYGCHVQTNRMGELMAAADLAIGAGGSVTWERCCLGLPAISICTANNQGRQITDAAALGLLYAPSGAGNLINTLKTHAKALLENNPLLKLISNAGMKAVDGKGVLRVATALSMNRISIRAATDRDSQTLFKWRNHPAIRSVSRNSQPIKWEDHQSWFSAVLADGGRLLLVGYIENRPVGVVRFDKEGDVAEVSIYLVPEGGFSGQGSNLLLSAEHWLALNRPVIKRIRAEVLADNLPSQQLFLGANYRVDTIYYLKEL